MDLVHLYVFEIAVEFEGVALDLALAGQFLKLFEEMILVIAIGEYFFNEGGVILPELRLNCVFVDEGLAEKD